MIAVEASGENFIIITAGANGTLAAADIDDVAAVLQQADAVLLQLEVPLPAVERTAAIAAAAGATVILNPAPADQPLPASLLRNLSILVPNETEACTLADATEPVIAAQRLLGLGVPTIVLTLGSQGAMIVQESGSLHVPAFPIVPVDTTAAGDAFLGGLAVGLVDGLPLSEAVRLAAAAGALAATRAGAQPSLPTRREALAFLSTS
jgi:ribokinase